MKENKETRVLPIRLRFMVSRIVCLLCCSLILPTAICMPPNAPDGLRVELLKNACSILTDNPTFSWTVQDDDNNETQSAYRIVFAKSLSDATGGNYFLDTGWVASSNSTAVTIDSLPALLEPNSLYYWQVQTKDKSGAAGPLSPPMPFTTAVTWANTNGIWLEAETADEKTNFLFLRHPFTIADRSQIEKAIVAATAFNTESAKQYVFDLSLNGQSVGVGPARNQNKTPSGNLLYYNSYDVTDRLKTGDNVIAALAYNKDPNRAFLLQMTVYYTDGTQEILLNSARDAVTWKAKDGTLAFGQTDEMAAPANWYRLHRENIAASQYPFGFDDAPFVEDATWRAVKPTGAINAGRTLVSYPSENMELHAMPAESVVRLTNGNYVVTLEKEIVGCLQLNLTSPAQQTIEIRLGEDLNADGSVRSDGRGHPNYIEHWTLAAGEQSLRSLNMKNFRYVELIGSPVEITADNVAGIALRQAFDDNAAGFTSSNPFLNELYAFAKYTVKATNQDVWTDSQARERGPYEGDAIINMASANAFSANYSIGRHSHEYLINNPTWPQEYKLFSVEMAWTDYLYTGDRHSLDKYYAKLKSKFPGTFNPELGLVSVAYTGSSDRVLIDWPGGERDNYRLQACTTGYNAVYAGACRAMAAIAEALGNETDRLFYQNRADTIRAALIRRLYNPEKGAFDDSMNENGALSEHYSQHATAYALAYGIYDSPEMADRLAAYIDNQGGFKTSIYAAFFVLRGLYNAGAGDVAMKLMADEDEHKIRTWAHVIRQLNATISPEAWDPANKSNMTFSHPWGSAPAAAIAQGMFGIRPIAPSFETFQIRFQPGGVQRAEIKIPTLRGTIQAAYNLNSGENGLTAEVVIPANTKAEISLPVVGVALSKIVVDGEPCVAERRGKFLTVTVGSGRHTLAL
jgi:alpha-L-rhamnosidase